jgi:hypothetical protein
MISKLAKRGMPLDSVEKARRWREENLNPAQRKRTLDDGAEVYASSLESFDEARRREKIAQADLAEMDARKARGELVEIAAVRKGLEAAFAAVNEGVMQIADRCAPVLAMRPEDYIRKTLKDECRAALTSLAELLRRAALDD